MSANVRTKDWLMRPSSLAAIVLLIIGSLFLLIEAQSPSRLYWTGQTVTGTERSGLVYYRVHGESYTVDDTRPDPPGNGVDVTVYLDPAAPAQALLDRPARWVDAAAVLIWFVAAAVCLTVSPLMRASRNRRREARIRSGDSFGEGLDPEWIARRVQRPPEA
jgi:hypothetical protein